MTNKHPCPGAWGWWAGQSDEWFEVGPCDTRADAIIEAAADEIGRYQRPGESAARLHLHVARAQVQHINLAQWFGPDDIKFWLERAGERMDENGAGADFDGNHHPLAEISNQDVADLLASIRSAIWHWQERKGYPLRSAWLINMTEVETIDIPLPDAETREESALALALAQLETPDA